MKPLRERNQALVGVVTVVMLCVAATGAFLFTDLPFVGSARTYSAHFTDSAGLTSGNEVHLAGVKVGEVTDVSLDGNRVLVEFTVDGTRLGSETTAAIQIKTLLGEKYLKVVPRGEGTLDGDDPIPVSRTRTPIDVPEAFTTLTEKTSKLDTEQLAKSFRVLSESLRGASPHMNKALDGLSKLSKTIASRDAKLEELLRNAGDVSQIAADRSKQVQKLVADGNLLLAELQRRREAISALLDGTRELSKQLRGLVADNREQLRPALTELDKLTQMLQDNQDKLRHSIKAMAPYVRAFTNSVGNGEWFDGYLCGLLPPPINVGPIHTNPTTCYVPANKSKSGGGR